MYETGLKMAILALCRFNIISDHLITHELPSDFIPGWKLIYYSILLTEKVTTLYFSLYFLAFWSTDRNHRRDVETSRNVCSLLRCEIPRGSATATSASDNGESSCEYEHTASYRRWIRNRLLISDKKTTREIGEKKHTKPLAEPEIRGSLY